MIEIKDSPEFVAASRALAETESRYDRTVKMLAGIDDEILKASEAVAKFDYRTGSPAAAGKILAELKAQVEVLTLRRNDAAERVEQVAREVVEDRLAEAMARRKQFAALRDGIAEKLREMFLQVFGWDRSDMSLSRPWAGTNLISYINDTLIPGCKPMVDLSVEAQACMERIKHLQSLGGKL